MCTNIRLWSLSESQATREVGRGDGDRETGRQGDREAGRRVIEEGINGDEANEVVRSLIARLQRFGMLTVHVLRCTPVRIICCRPGALHKSGLI